MELSRTSRTRPTYSITHTLKDQLYATKHGALVGRQILVADDFHHQIYAIDNLGNVNYDPFVPGVVNFFFGAEQVLVIPESPCTYCPGALLPGVDSRSNGLLVSAKRLPQG